LADDRRNDAGKKEGTIDHNIMRFVDALINWAVIPTSKVGISAAPLVKQRPAAVAPVLDSGLAVPRANRRSTDCKVFAKGFRDSAAYAFYLYYDLDGS
jgi:hypothetical protein